MEFDKLFSPFSIGSLDVQNRIVMPPMATNFATKEGFVTEQLIAYYVQRARGDAGYITIEHTGILQQGKSSPNMLLIGTEEHALSIEKLIQSIHEEGGKVVVQINHAGRQASSSVTGSPIVGPSPISCPTKNEIPRELSIGEIQGLVESFSLAAERIKRAGADGIEIHMAHGYLICSFLSPFSNKRSDHYGGDIQRRARFAVEVLNSVRGRVGEDFPIICRMIGEEYVHGGIDITQAIRIAQILEREGADALHVSGGNIASIHMIHPPYYVEEGVFIPWAKEVKSNVKIPVIAVGRIRDPAMAEQILQDGKADLISMGRALIADPHLPRKAKEGKGDEIIPCISCNRCIQTQRKGSFRCSVNPETGNESLLRVVKSDQPKRVWIVGGGPGGLKAAEIAARRGHKVTIFEKDMRLGGRMRLAAIPPKKAVLNDFLGYLERTVKALGVTLELGKEFQAEMLEPNKPDGVIVATGAMPRPPEWKGVKESEALSIDEVLANKREVGRKVLVVGGGGIGAEMADLLSEMGKEVTLVEMLEEIASDLVTHLKYCLSQRLVEKGVTIFTSTKVKELGKGYAIVETASGVRKIHGFDTIILASGSIPNDAVVKSLKGKVSELYVIGDALQPREVLEAISEGQEIGMKI